MSPSLSHPLPLPLFFAILFPVFNTETEIGFNSLIIKLVLVSHRPMIRLDELTQLCSTLCRLSRLTCSHPFMEALIGFSSRCPENTTAWFSFSASCVLTRVRLRLKSLA